LSLFRFFTGVRRAHGERRENARNLEKYNAVSTNTPQLDYMLLFRGTDWHKGLSPESVQIVMNQWYDWFERLAQQGRATSGRPLAYEGKLVTGKSGRTVIDGPFAESKEAIGGYFLLHVKNEEEAIEIARHCPGLEHGVEVEVRRVVEFCPSGELAGLPAAEMEFPAKRSA
jgi:hypothetical protein